MEKEIKKLTEEQKSAIAEYLESRLGVYGVRSFKFDWEETPNLAFLEVGVHPLNLADTGVLKHMLSDVKLHARVWGKDNPKTVDICFTYTHWDGGGNGHNTDITLIVHEGGRVFEK